MDDFEHFATNQTFIKMIELSCLISSKSKFPVDSKYDIHYQIMRYERSKVIGKSRNLKFYI